MRLLGTFGDTKVPTSRDRETLLFPWKWAVIDRGADGDALFRIIGRSGRFSKNIPRVSAKESASSKPLVLAALTDTPPIPPILLPILHLPTLTPSNSKNNPLAEPATV